MTRKVGPPTTFPRFAELPSHLRHRIWTELMAPRIVYLQKESLWWARAHRVWSSCANDAAGNLSFFDADPFPSAEACEYPKDLRLGEAVFRRKWDSWSAKAARYNKPCAGFRSSEPLMPVAAACRESYRIFSSRYTRAFGSESAFPETWIDFDRDTLYLDIWQSSPEGELVEVAGVWGAWWNYHRGRPTVPHSLKELSGDEIKKVRLLAVNVFATRLNVRFDFQSWAECLSELFKNAETITLVNADEVHRYHDGYRGPRKVDFAFVERGYVRLRKVCWQTYKGGYHPFSYREMMKEYDVEVAEINNPCVDRISNTYAAGHLLNMLVRFKEIGFNKLRAGQQAQSTQDFSNLDMLSHLTHPPKRQPCIEIKDAELNSVIDEFERDKEEYFHQKSAFRLTINLHTRGHQSLHLQVNETATIKELISIARQEWNVPEDRACEGVFDENHLELPLVTFEERDDSLLSTLALKEREAIYDDHVPELHDRTKDTAVDTLVCSGLWKGTPQDMEIYFQRKRRPRVNS